MRFELKTDLCSLAEYLPEFLSIAGSERWKKRALQLGADAVKSPFQAKIVADYHWLEIALSKQMIVHETAGNLIHELVTVESLAALYFAQTVVEAHRRLPLTGRMTLEGRIRNALNAEAGFAPLYLEMDTARRLVEAGFEVEFSDMEGVARYDLRFWRGKTEGEVECKSLSTDAGRKIHRPDFYRFIDAIGSGLVDRAASGAREVLLIAIEDRLPSATAQQTELRSAARRMLAEPNLARAYGSFFTITRDDPARLASSAAATGARDFYRRCCEAYGDNCHVSGATTTPEGGCFIVMRSGREDDHSKPLLEALKKAAEQLSATRPAFIAVQFDDITPTDLLLPHIHRRAGILSYHLFHKCRAAHVAATYFCIYGGLVASAQGIGVPAFAIPNPNPYPSIDRRDYTPFFDHIPDAEFAALLGTPPQTKNLSLIELDTGDP